MGRRKLAPSGGRNEGLPEACRTSPAAERGACASRMLGWRDPRGLGVQLLRTAVLYDLRLGSGVAVGDDRARWSVSAFAGAWITSRASAASSGVGREQLGVLARAALLGVDELVEPVAQTVAVGRGLVVMGAGAGDPEMVDLGLVVAGAGRHGPRS
jgi:hypothetical protein